MSDYTPAAFAAEFGVPRETMDRLTAFDALFLDTASKMNLVARSTLADRWDRHFRDSAQLAALVPAEARSILDLGSGAGFPGLVLAAMGAPFGRQVTLVESIRKKASFLRDAATEMGLTNVCVRDERIEALRLPLPDVVTARALASLPQLLAYVAPFVGGKTICIFPKGQDVEEELTQATKSWRMAVESRESLTRPGSQILIVRGLSRRPG